MGNLMGHQGAVDRLETANAVRSATAARLVGAQKTAKGKSARAAVLYPERRSSLSLLNALAGETPKFNPNDHAELTPEQEAILRGQLDARIQKVLDIIALMLNDAQSDTVQMQETLDIIRGMDDIFFDFPEASVDGEEVRPRKTQAAFAKYYYYKRFYTAAAAVTKVPVELYE